MSSAEIVPVDIQTIEAGLEILRKEANAIVVKDQQSYITACDLALDTRNYIKDVKAKMNPGIAKARALVDSLRNDLLRWVTPAEQIEAIVSQKAEAWKRAEREAAERERQRIQAEAAAAARIKAEEERREAERIAKEQRVAREAELEAQRKAGEIGKREQARLAKIAAEEQAAANALAAQQALETAAAVPILKVEAAIPKVAGIKARVNWKFRIVDEANIPRAYLMPNEVAIGRYVREMKEKAHIFGVEVYSEDGI